MFFVFQFTQTYEYTVEDTQISFSKDYFGPETSITVNDTDPDEIRLKLIYNFLKKLPASTVVSAMRIISTHPNYLDILFRKLTLF